MPLFTIIFWLLISLCQIATCQDQFSELTNSIGMKMVRVTKGEFNMGLPGRNFNELDGRVSITRDFYLGVTEVTQSQFEMLMRRNPSFFQGVKVNGNSGAHPVESVTWNDAVEFCRRLSELPDEKKAGRSYRLPTEAEWEYSCRAGSATAFCFGDSSKSLGDYAWYEENSPKSTRQVGQKKPNAWGLYDMHGNVSEWCSDWYGVVYPKGRLADPTGPKEGAGRVVRGGCYGSLDLFCESGYRDAAEPSDPRDDIGFRVLLVIPENTK